MNQKKSIFIVVILLAFTLIGLSTIADPGNPAFIPGDSLTVGVNGPIGLSFPQPMQQESVESRLEILPSVAGEWVWQDNQALYRNTEPFRVGEM